MYYPSLSMPQSSPECLFPQIQTTNAVPSVLQQVRRQVMGNITKYPFSPPTLHFEKPPYFSTKIVPYQVMHESFPIAFLQHAMKVTCRLWHIQLDLPTTNQAFQTNQNEQPLSLCFRLCLPLSLFIIQSARNAQQRCLPVSYRTVYTALCILEPILETACMWP